MTREKWEAMTPEERKAWRERKNKRDIIDLISVPVIVSIIVSPVTAKIVLSLLHNFSGVGEHTEIIRRKTLIFNTGGQTNAQRLSDG